MKPKTFEEFLQDWHADAFPTLVDDDMPDHFDDWVGAMEPGTIIGLAECAVKEADKAGYRRGVLEVLDQLKFGSSIDQIKYLLQ